MSSPPGDEATPETPVVFYDKRITVFPSKGEKWFAETYPALSEDLEQSADVNHESELLAFTAKLADKNPPHIVLIIDAKFLNDATSLKIRPNTGEHILQTMHAPIEVIQGDDIVHTPAVIKDQCCKSLMEYMENSGGTVILACNFAHSAAKPGNLDWILCQWDLSWETLLETKYLELQVNRDNPDMLPSPAKLTQSFTERGVYLTNVEASNAVYTLSSGSNVQLTKTPVAWKAIGQTGGHLGYVGLVNNEEGGRQVILAMCGF